MQFTRLRWIAIVAALLVLAFGYASLTRTVTIMADNQVTTIATRALTVGGALKDAELFVHSQDRVEPSTWSLVTDGLVINVVRAARVQLSVDGKTYSAVTAELDPLALIARWGFQLNDGDRLVLAGRTLAEGEILPQAAFVSLELRRPVVLSVRDGDTLIEFQSSAPTLGEALAEEGIQLFASDRVDPVAESVLAAPMTVTIVRAEPLFIIMGESVYEVRTAATTVGEALADAGIALQGLDRSQPDEDQLIPTDRRIRITRVTETVSLELDVIPHQVSWQQDPEAEVGTTTVMQEGQDGVSATRVRMRYENGEEGSRQEEGVRVLVQARDQINGYGSQFVIRTTVIDGVEIEYWATMTMFATSYSPCRSGVGKCLYGTSSGLPVQKGVVSTYLDWYRAYKGGSIYVPGYGPAVFGDVGRYPDGRAWIDLGYSDADWVGWSQWVTVYFTTPIPSSIPYFLQQ